MHTNFTEYLNPMISKYNTYIPYERWSHNEHLMPKFCQNTGARHKHVLSSHLSRDLPSHLSKYTHA